MATATTATVEIRHVE